ncbi:DUF917 domain-containing protein [Kibdelosporangium phytohabitans]|uniref:Hydantoinase n=1 Tax=Kibdelosporangium phytohabitans TaxID=860235 RepID=A0A0N9HYH9_9PSEU|nr:DUF917 domain-containing protein [Kibdelosporangium phytohabitans]ALG07333.1 hypothetical protein AOZ06_10720 [Kibdelosporangium phytohabitans]MBE1471799.1 DUF917 family protein [Kibdelosporangium phytohabitans]
MREILLSDVDDIARGAAILGAGGGGDPYIGKLLAEVAIERHGPVPSVDIDEVPPDAVVVPVSTMGAPTVGTEKLPSGHEATAALRALERVMGKQATHLVPIEIGGVNSVIPIAAAAETGLPLVDGDAMGRAFPEAHMVLPSLIGVSCTPMVIVDDKGNTTVLDTVDNRWAERLARSVCIEAGCSVFTADTVLTGEQLRAGLVAGTMTLAHRLGRAVRLSPEPVATASALLDGHLLITGKVVDVDRATTGGFARGHARVEGIGGHRGSRLTLSFQNEHLVAERDGEVVTSTPDLICVLDNETGQPVTTEGLRYGNRVAVLGVPCDSRWTTREGLRLTGPRAFGYDHDYRPITAVPNSLGSKSLGDKR